MTKLYVILNWSKIIVNEKLTKYYAEKTEKNISLIILDATGNDSGQCLWPE